MDNLCGGIRIILEYEIKIWYHQAVNIYKSCIGVDSMAMKVMWAGALFCCGWFWFFIFIRQFLFNLITAYPLIKKMNNTQKDLIAITAARYTTVSVITCGLLGAIIAAVIIRFCSVYLIAGFFAGALLALVMYSNKLSPKTRSIFDTFCNAYYRFVFDDELRTAMYNKKPSQMKQRLHDMGLSTDFIPEFKN